MPASFESFDYVSRNQRAPLPPKWVDARVLAAGVPETFAVPTANGQKPGVVAFSASGANLYVAYTPAGSADVTAAIPGGDVADGSASECNPGPRAIGDTTKISLVADAPCIVTLAYYAG